MKANFRLFLISFIVIFAFSSFKKNEKIFLSPSNTIIVSTKNYPIGASFLHQRLNKIYNKDPFSNESFTILREYSELTRDQDTAGKIVFSIGDNHFNKDITLKNLPTYSFIIKKNSNLIIIKGANDTATNLGVSYFLDHYCGVRFYLPGDLFTIMPATHLVSLPLKINVTESPFTYNITSTGFYGTGDSLHPHDILQWDSYWAMMNGLARNSLGPFQHTMSTIFKDSEIIKRYPEAYPLINGKRYFPTSADDQNFEPDFASPQLTDASIYAAIKYFKANPSIDYMAFSVMDGGGYSKEGKIGKFLSKYPQTNEGNTRGNTDAFVQFLNNLAKSLPAALAKNGIQRPKKIVYLSYNQVRDIPKEKLNSNIVPITVYHLSNAIADSFYFQGGTISKWAKVTSNIGNDDWAEGKGFIYPRIYTGIVSQFVKAIQKNKLNFIYAHIEAYPNWALDGPKYYEMGKIYWNPGINIDSVRTQFCNDMFGNASAKMHEYFNTAEQISTWLNNHSVVPTHMFNYIGQLGLDDTRMLLVKQARQLLDEAASTRSITEDEKKRIDFFSKGFRISESFFELYNSKVAEPAKANELTNYLKNEIAGDPRILYISADKNFLAVMDNLIDQIEKSK